MQRRSLILAPLLLACAAPLRAEEAAAPQPTDFPADDLAAYPRCANCNMDRRRFHHGRHVLHYGDGHGEGTCSVRCAAECMLKERRRGFTAIYAADNGVPADPKPLVEVSAARYLIGSDLPGVMTAISKVPFADENAARQAQRNHGGEIADFATAVKASLEEAASGVLRRYSTDLGRLQRRSG